MQRFLTVLLFLASSTLFAAEPVKIFVTDFGAEPNSKKDSVAAVAQALEACKTHESAILVFPKGRYDFYAPQGNRIFSMNIDGQKNLTIDGQGSEFFFHGIIGVARLNESENVTMKNLSVDWEKPYIAQGNIVQAADDHFDVQFDTQEYPFEVTEGQVFFTGFPGGTGKRQLDGYCLLFDKETKELVTQTRDYWHSPNGTAEHLRDNVIRFHGRLGSKPEPGTYMAFWLGRYIQVAIDLMFCKDIVLENIDIYHALSHGVNAFKVENLTLRKVNYKTNDQKDRVFTIVADGYHLNTCKGLVKIEHCSQVGMGDDFLNLHGMNVMVQKRIDDYTVEVGVSGRGNASYVLGAGDEVWFLDGSTVQRGETGTIREIKEIREGSRLIAKHIIFEQKIPDVLKEQDVLENKTWNAELEVRHCRILKQHRARGLLISTPLRAVVENNYFRTAGAAILVEGDVNYWYESGGVNDLVIRNNVFEDCFSSGYAGDWWHAVITIHPSFRPQSVEDEAYHRNIRVENNEFKSFDYPILFARSVRNLKFIGNTLSRTATYLPFAQSKATFVFDGCREVLIEGNTYAEDLLGKNIQTEHMKPDDLAVKDAAIRQ